LKRPWALPLVPLYVAGAALRWVGVTPKRLAWPVISIGSLSAGGAGKTPFVIALALLLKREGFQIDVLSRGYGRTGFDAQEVIISGSPEDYGDEPLLIARETDAPVYVGASRWKAGWLAEAVADESGLGVGWHLLDDGFQHRQLARNVDIALVSSEDLADWLIPAGNLREGFGALKRTTVLAVPAGDDSAVEQLQRMGLKQPVWRYRRAMAVPAVSGPVVAFCGIARPEQFFAGLEGAGAQIAGRKVFRDHHRFEERDLESLRRLVEHTGASGLVTTAKDRVRMGTLAKRLEMTTPVYTAGLRVMLEDEAGVAAWLKLRLQS